MTEEAPPATTPVEATEAPGEIPVEDEAEKALNEMALDAETEVVEAAAAQTEVVETAAAETEVVAPPAAETEASEAAQAAPAENEAVATKETAAPAENEAVATEETAAPAENEAVATEETAPAAAVSAEPLATELVESSAEIAAPTSELVESSAEIAAPTSELVEPSTEIAAPTSELVEPSTEIAAPTSEAVVAEGLLETTPAQKMAEYYKSPLEHLLADPLGLLSPRGPAPQEDLKTLQEVLKPKTLDGTVQDAKDSLESKETIQEVKAQDGSRPGQPVKSLSLFSHGGCWIRPSAVAPKLRAQGLRDPQQWGAKQGPRDRAGRYMDHLKNMEGLPDKSSVNVGEDGVKVVAEALGALSSPCLRPLLRPRNASGTSSANTSRYTTPDPNKVVEALASLPEPLEPPIPEANEDDNAGNDRDLKNPDVETATTCGGESTVADDVSEVSRTMMTGDPSLASLPSMKSLKSLPESQGIAEEPESEAYEQDNGHVSYSQTAHEGFYQPMMPKPGHPSLVSSHMMGGLYGSKMNRPFGGSARAPWKPGVSQRGGTLSGAGASVIGSSKAQDKYGQISARSDPGAVKRVRAAAAGNAGFDDEDLPGGLFEGEFPGYPYTSRRASTPKNSDCPFSGGAIDEAVVLKCGHRFNLKHLDAAINGSKSRTADSSYGHIICPLCGDICNYLDPHSKRPGLLGVYSDSKKAYLGDHLGKDFKMGCSLPGPGGFCAPSSYSSGYSLAPPPSMIRGAPV